MTVWGYVRVSTTAQDVEMQRQAMRAAGVDDAHVIEDYVTSAKESRPGLDRLLEQVVEGDVLTVWKLDRLGRSVLHLIDLVNDLGRRGVQFRSLTDDIDTTTPGGRFYFHITAAYAQLERDLIRQRTTAGLEAAKAKGKVLGRPSRITPEQYRLIRRMAAEGTSHRTIGATCGVARSTVGRVVRGEVPSLRKYNDPDGDELPVTTG